MKKNLLLAMTAVALLGASAIGSTSAARTVAQNDAIIADFETAQVVTSVITTTDGYKTFEALDDTDIFASVENFEVGVINPVYIGFVNGNADDSSFESYARVTITKSWWNGTGENATKNVTLNPSLIEVAFDENFVASDWIKDEAASTAEREVYYYTKPVAAGQVVPFLGGVMISNDVNEIVTTTSADDGVIGNIKTSYDYNGKSVGLSITVDEIQTHSADKAALAAWGVFVKTDGTNILRVSHDEEVQ